MKDLRGTAENKRLLPPSHITHTGFRAWVWPALFCLSLSAAFIYDSFPPWFVAKLLIIFEDSAHDISFKKPFLDLPSQPGRNKFCTFGP